MTNKLSTLTQLAETHLHIETLETRKSDSLDFHECSVWSIKAALEAAYEAGRNSMKKPTRSRFGKNSRIGTSYKAAVKIKYQELVDTWGPPQAGSDDKVEAEWAVRLPGGRILTIYNYKNSRKYHDTYPPVTEVQRWHIGGHEASVVDSFLGMMGGRAELLHRAD